MSSRPALCLYGMALVRFPAVLTLALALAAPAQAVQLEISLDASADDGLGANPSEGPVTLQLFPVADPASAMPSFEMSQK